MSEKATSKIYRKPLMVASDISSTRKSVGGFLVSLLTAEVNPENIRSVFCFLSDRIVGKPIALELEANGKKLKVVASNSNEIKTVLKAAKEFISD